MMIWMRLVAKDGSRFRAKAASNVSLLRSIRFTEHVAAEPPRSLLDPLTDNQQRFIDLVGEVYANQPGTWPVFDYVQRTLDQDRIDAIETFESFPTLTVLGGNHRAIWSGGGLSWPHPDQTIVLTVIGMHHCNLLRG